MVEERVDQLTGAVVAISPSRQDRPNLPATGCPFCVGRLEAPGPSDVKAFGNRWPSLPDDRCEIVLYSAIHDATFWSIGVDQATKVVDLWAERTVALGARPDVASVLVGENRGAIVGATIDHPHGQVYAYDAVPEAPRAELRHDGCPICEDDPGDRVVAETDGWRAWVPWAAVHPYELWPGAPERLMPSMLWFHQRPTDGGTWPNAHLHGHIAVPMRAPGVQRYVAAMELGSGRYVNPVAPDHAAAELRAVTWPG